MRNWLDIEWSQHARERAVERGISEEAVELVLLFGETKRTSDGLLLFIPWSALEQLTQEERELVWGVGVALRRDRSLITTVLWRKECDRRVSLREVGKEQRLRMSLGEFLRRKSTPAGLQRLKEWPKEKLHGVEQRCQVSVRGDLDRLSHCSEPQIKEVAWTGE